MTMPAYHTLVLESMRRHLEEQPDDREARLIVADLLMEEGDWEEAVWQRLWAASERRCLRVALPTLGPAASLTADLVEEASVPHLVVATPAVSWRWRRPPPEPAWCVQYGWADVADPGWERSEGVPQAVRARSSPLPSSRFWRDQPGEIPPAIRAAVEAAAILATVAPEVPRG